jgi:EEF1A lysine methyltransferase 2
VESNAQHWDDIFDATEDARLGWYEKDVAPTLTMLEMIPGWEDATIFLSGAGTSVLADALLAAGTRLVLNDISAAALDRLKERLGDGGNAMHWLCQDISQPLPPDLPAIDIWIDRAVLHFLTAEEEIEGYFKNLRSALRVGGHVLLAEFSKDGAPKCAGLTLHRYSAEELSERVGESFSLVSCFDHTYLNPNGDPRPYIYALYRKGC